jgi:formylglycine-generating enzyme required for sulfatase activity
MNDPEREALIFSVSTCGGHSYTELAGANEDLPVNCVPWYAAFAFCAWDGGRLPSMAEWNYAAAGGDEQRVRPWLAPGAPDLIDATFASYGHPCCSLGEFSEVGHHPKGNGRWGHADLAGNVDEWVRDSAGFADPSTCVDCALIDANAKSYIQAGGWAGSSADELLIPRFFGASPPDAPAVDAGFRCARNLAH